MLSGKGNSNTACYNFTGVPYFTLLYKYEVMMNQMHKSCIKKEGYIQESFTYLYNIHSYMYIYLQTTFYGYLSFPPSN